MVLEWRVVVVDVLLDVVDGGIYLNGVLIGGVNIGSDKSGFADVLIYPGNVWDDD